MFGSGNNVSSTWGSTQQPNQQQPSAFGQSGTFGSGAFGSGNTSAFGQPQQQQQQQQQQPQNPMFGNTNGTTGTTGFGAFGPNQAQAGGGAFGSKPAGTGFGAFGGGGGGAFGSGAFGGSGGGGAFGNAGASANPAGAGLFSAPSTGQFGGGAGLFNKPATTFGTTPNATDAAPPVTTGTANPPFTAYPEKDAMNSSITLQYQSITALPAYRSSSLEELRWQDYQQGRKTAGAFGQNSFGTPAQPSTGLFGQAANQPAATGTSFGGFGNTSSTNQPAGSGAFGGNTFGQPNPNPAGGLFGGFGQQNQQPQSQPQPQQQQQQSTFNTTFGQPGTQQPNAGLFGGGAFTTNNNNQPKPAFGFGSGGAFGAQTQTQQQPATTGLFGQPAQQPAATNNAFGGGNVFGQNAAKAPLFGGTPNPPSAFSGAFGQANPQQQPSAQPTTSFGGGGLFGQNNQQPQQQQSGLFGAQPTQPQTGGGLFGGGGGGLFGAQQPQQPQQTQAQNAFGTGLFGPSKLATANPQSGGGLFGNFGANSNTAPAQTQPTSIFNSSALGQQPQAAQQSNAFGGFFNKPAAPALGASTSTAQPNLGGSFFGGNLGASTGTLGASALGQSQTPLTASIAQPISTNLPIFSMLPPGPRAVTLDQQPKKKPGYFVDVPTRAPGPQLQLRYAPATAKLRGFGSTSTAPGTGSNQLNSSLLFASGKPNALSLSKTSANKSLLGPDAFLTNGRSSPTLGSGSRQSVKKLTLDKRIDAVDLFNKPTSVPSFNPKLSMAARELEAAVANSSGEVARLESPIAARSSPHKSGQNRFVAQTTSEILGTGRPTAPGKGPHDPSELQEGEYWVKPDLDTLKKMGHDDLMSFSGLVVGRIGYGQITFLEPVDLTGLPRLSSLLGEIVRFDDKECSVYPDVDEAEKPSPGSGLNVMAEIELVRCWALDKATREPIKDEAHPAAQRHLKRLRGMKHTHFKGFDLEKGQWTFTVDHF